MPFNPPPNWPAPPQGWTPPPGWQPDAEWGPPPEGWQLWTDKPGLLTEQLRKRRRTNRNVLIGVGAGLAVFTVVGIASGTPTDDTAAGDAVSAAAGAKAMETGPTTQPEPEPEPAALVLAEPRAYSGNGADVVTFGDLGDTIWTAKITHSGGRNFAVWAVDEHGQDIDLVVNEIGSYNGVRPVNFSEDPAAFKVEADGAWTIELTDVRALPVWDGNGTYSGTGASVVNVAGAAEGLTPVTITHQGESNFAVWGWGDRRDLIVNEIGDYTGTTLLPGGTILLDVEADGAWTVTK